MTWDSLTCLACCWDGCCAGGLLCEALVLLKASRPCSHGCEGFAAADPFQVSACYIFARVKASHMAKPRFKGAEK